MGRRTIWRGKQLHALHLSKHSHDLANRGGFEAIFSPPSTGGHRAGFAVVGRSTLYGFGYKSKPTQYIPYGHTLATYKGIPLNPFWINLAAAGCRIEYRPPRPNFEDGRTARRCGSILGWGIVIPTTPQVTLKF